VVNSNFLVVNVNNVVSCVLDEFLWTTWFFEQRGSFVNNVNNVISW
jgi:hypothetical protein